MADINEELRVLVTAEVEKAIKDLQKVDRQTSDTKKMFKKLGAAITGAFSAKAMMDFAAKSVQAYKTQKEAVSVLNAVLQATGATAWTTSEQLQQMASSLQSVTNYGDEAIISMQSVLLGFMNIKGDQFEEATKAVLDMATVMKIDLKSAAQTVGKALDDPIHGLDSLRRQGFQFTVAQRKMLKEMVEAGKLEEAQAVILDTLASSYGGAAEAAADWSTQAKNAIGDAQEALVKFAVDSAKVFKATWTNNGDSWLSKEIERELKSIDQAMGSMYTYNKEAGILINSINLATAALNNFWDVEKMAEAHAAKALGDMDRYNAWFKSLSNEAKLEELARQYANVEAEYNKAMDKKNWKRADELDKELRAITKQSKAIADQISEAQKLQDAENRRAKTESDIYDLMEKIGTSYEKMSKDDPAVQLKNYKKELEEIAKKRETLLTTPAYDKEGTLIPTDEALEQLDYIEKKIREKIAGLQDDGKKTWQKWFSEIADISEEDFNGGKEAAQAYLAQLEAELKKSKKFSEMLGEKFDLKSALEKQQQEIRKVLEDCFDIDPTKIDEAFTTQDKLIQILIERYRQLGIEIKDAMPGDKETAQLERYSDLWGLISQKTEEAFLNIEGFSESAAASMGNLTSSLAQLAGNAAVSGLKEIGKALGEGKDAGDALEAGLRNMAIEIMNHLPLLMTQAGLQLIAQGQWPLGLALLGSGLLTGIVGGYVEGAEASKTSGTAATTNALGGVYGAEDYAAFAKGGAFTNQIVASPTYFRFAKGSGFGTGLMGEAGPEAIMPLTRGADGSLGVSASGIGANVDVSIPVTVYSDEPVEVHDMEDDSGQRKIEILVGSMINRHIADGKADRALRGRYGLKVQGV